MAYADAFSECMQGSNITVDPSVVTDPSYFGDAVKYIKSWLDGLESSAKQALDDASQYAERVAGYLVDANIAPGVPALLEAFDATSGTPLSTFVDWCVYCADQASQSNDNSNQNSNEGGN